MKKLFIVGAGVAHKIEPSKLLREPQKMPPGRLKPGTPSTPARGEKK
jgi:hypothetical protein